MTPVTLPVAIVIVLSLVMGVITQGVQSGNLFGWIVVPKAWLPPLTTAGTFLAGVLAYLQGLPSGWAFSGSILFYAAVAGITALLAGAAPGIAGFAHHVVPRQVVEAKRAAKMATIAAATKVAAVMLLLAAFASGCGSAPPPPPNTGGDVVKELNCVAADVFVSGVTDVGQVAKDCTAGELGLASDLLSWLLEFDRRSAALPAETKSKIQASIAAKK